MMPRPRLPGRLVAAAGLVLAAIGGLLVVSEAFRRRESAELDAAAARLPSLASAREMPTSPGIAGETLQAMFDARERVRSATLSVEVAAYPEAAENAVAIARAHGGYLADSRVSRVRGGRQRGTLMLRVEAHRFEDAFRALKSLGKVQAASVETRDVTRAYADLEARLDAKRRARERMDEILRIRTAGLADLVAAERELSRLIEETDRLEGERRYYERQRALSTIAVDLAEPAPFLDGALAPLSAAFRAAVPLLAGSAAAMVYAVAAALPWAVAALAIGKLRRRATGRRLFRVPAQG